MNKIVQLHQSVFTTIALFGFFSAVDETHAEQVTILTSDGNGADTYIRGGIFANSNFGNDTVLTIKNDSGFAFDRKAYLRFDLNSVQAPIVDVELIITTGSVSDSGNDPNTSHFRYVYALDDSSSGQSWDEFTTTWNNAPGNDPNSGVGITSDANLLGTYSRLPTVQLGDEVAFSSPNLTAAILADSDGLFTLILTDKTGTKTGSAPASRENGAFSPPRLLITTMASQFDDFDGNGRFDAFDFLAWQRDPGIGNLADWEANYGLPLASNATKVPEPATFILAVAGVGLGLSRRRR